MTILGDIIKSHGTSRIVSFSPEDQTDPKRALVCKKLQEVALTTSWKGIVCREFYDAKYDSNSVQFIELTPDLLLETSDVVFIVNRPNEGG